MVRAVNLMDDIGTDNGCVCEHGLSFYIETPKHKLLVDTGASDKFLKNAEKLSIDLKKVDTVILSHGHYDHGGGILSFVRINPTAKIYIRENALECYCHGERYIGIDSDIRALPQVVMVSGNLKIDEELFLYTNVTERRSWPSGNRELICKKEGKVVQDDFSHEQYLVIQCEEKSILISGCAHNGMLNILKKYENITGGVPDYVISGFHMVKKHGYKEEDFEVIIQTAEELKKLPTKFYTGHCTGEIPYNIMKEIMGDQIQYIHCGEPVF